MKEQKKYFWLQIVGFTLIVVMYACHTRPEPADPVTDIDGNVYKTVRIGDQVWMAENLRVTRYNSGDTISFDLNDTEWENTVIGAYAIHPHDDLPGFSSFEEMVSAYGKLYNWYAVETGKLCMDGWRVPGVDDWMKLIDNLGGKEKAGGKLKATGTLQGEDGLWGEPNRGATNETGFSAFPGGSRLSMGRYSNIGKVGIWWCINEDTSNYAWYASTNNSYGNVHLYKLIKNTGFSVRCIRN